MRKRKLAILLALSMSLTGLDVPFPIQAATKQAVESTLKAESTIPKFVCNDITTKKVSPKEKEAFCTVTYQNLSLDGSQYPQLNQALKKWSEDSKTAVMKCADETTSSIEAIVKSDSSMKGKMHGSVDQSIALMRSDARVLSYEVSRYNFQGGAHGSNSVYGVNFQTSTGKRLFLSDITTNRAKLEQIANSYIQKKLARFYKDGLYPEYKETLKKELASKYTKFSLTDHGVRFYFNEYELACHAAGLVQVDIPYYLLGSCLKKEYMPKMNSPMIYQLRDNNAYVVKDNGERKQIVFRMLNDRQGGISEAYITLDGKKVSIQKFTNPKDIFYAYCYYIKNEEGKQYLILKTMGSNAQNELSLYELSEGKAKKLDTLSGDIVESTMDSNEFKVSAKKDASGNYTDCKTYFISDAGKFTAKTSKN